MTLQVGVFASVDNVLRKKKYIYICDYVARHNQCSTARVSQSFAQNVNTVWQRRTICGSLTRLQNLMFAYALDREGTVTRASFFGFPLYVSFVWHSSLFRGCEGEGYKIINSRWQPPSS